ncbi:BTAD domain-containing putative transcriptional regulator [Microbispora siamensis]|uniref:OmpR/PhoB-type domain-containing protein n=1 Tax=Microbispora siamensis TaxID=564413 RepID=A0ABQ4GJP0_9ACTN|nr:BTAD domain-containing putative transcriptional regulator [Microbispora siamensis]GIH61643.1 hypothetical protein Msi02_24600 [Microbispora siamensis]
MAELMPPTTTVAAAPAPTGGGRESGPTGEGVGIRVLGPLEVVGGDGLPLHVGTPKVRTLLAVLVLAEGRPVPATTLIDRIWGPNPPAEALASLQVYVSHLRRILEPERLPRARSRVLTFDHTGYRLTVDPRRVDVVRFLALVAEAEHAADPRATERAAAEALELWRGEPYADLGGQEYAAGAVARLVEARERARELRVSAVLRQGRHQEVVGELEALTHEHPLHEPLWALRALALYRCGRQGDALEVLRAARRTLADELGIDPGDELRELEQHILRQSPHLRLPGARTPLPVSPAASAPGPFQALGPAGLTATPATGGRVGTGTDATPRATAGRRGELAALDHLLEAGEAGRPGIALITGEPGIGKSHLAERVAVRGGDRGHAVAFARCPATPEAPPLWPWTRLLHQLVSGAAPEGTVPTASGVGPCPQADPAPTEFETCESAAHLLAAHAVQRPVLIVLDDLHHAAPAMLRLVTHLVDALTHARVTIVATARDWPAPCPALADTFAALARRHALRLPLAGLTPGELAELTAGHASHDDLRSLHVRTGGNPLFAIELLRHTTAGASGGLPPGVRDLVHARIRSLPEPTGALLRAAAISGRHFDPVVAARLAGLTLDATLRHLELAMAAGLVSEGRPGRFAFVHALVQETLADGVSALRRARLNDAIDRTTTPLKITHASRTGTDTGAAVRRGASGGGCLVRRR